MVRVAYDTLISALDIQQPAFPYCVRKKKINNHASFAQITITIPLSKEGVRVPPLTAKTSPW